jgi:hypothetical protein
MDITCTCRASPMPRQVHLGLINESTSFRMFNPFNTEPQITLFFTCSNTGTLIQLSHRRFKQSTRIFQISIGMMTTVHLTPSGITLDLTLTVSRVLNRRTCGGRISKIILTWRQVGYNRFYLQNIKWITDGISFINKILIKRYCVARSFLVLQAHVYI